MDPSIYRLRHQDLLALCVLSLILVGVVMVQSASANLSSWATVTLTDGSKLQGELKVVADDYAITGADGEVTRVAVDSVATIDRTRDVRWQWSKLGTKHLQFAAFAVVTFLVVGRIDYNRLAPPGGKWWRAGVIWVLAGAAVLCVLVLVPGIGKAVNGARRWIMIGPLQVQPSELAKWSLVLFLAWWLARRPVNLDRFFGGFLLTTIPIGLVCGLIVIEDFGTAALIGLCALTMLVVGRVKWWHLAVVIPPAIAAAIWFVRSEPYRWQRMTSFLDPWAAPQGEGYHMVQSLLSFSTGGLLGRGLGNGVQKLGYLPEDTTDFIFAVICEELGIFGALLVVVLYGGILFVGWQVIKDKRDDFGRLLAFGISSMLGLQAAINIAVATVSVPTKGLSLPLISAGGSGLVITCAALGVLYSVTRYAPDAESESDVETALDTAEAPTPRRRRKPHLVSARHWEAFTAL